MYSASPEWIPPVVHSPSGRRFCLCTTQAGTFKIISAVLDV